MKTFVLTLLAVASLAPPGFPARQDFRVELFSHRVVNALTVEAVGQAVTLCGSKTDGPCLVLPPPKGITCSADRMVHCRSEGVDRTFAHLNVESIIPFRAVPTSANGHEQPQTFLMQNARMVPAGGRLQITTNVDLESYVSGVLRGEASVLQAPAARRAMAILARTWALRWHGRHQTAGFDFCSLTHCQVFRLPQGGEVKAGDGLDAAASATRGQFLQYHGKLADPYFTASCGGMTEAAGNVWPDRAQVYLTSVHDPYCRTSSHAAWKQTLTAETLQPVLRESMHLPMTVPLTDLSVQRRDSSGRAILLRVVAGGVWDIDANKFRYAVDRRLGWQQIKSNFYSIEHQKDSWVFSGRGLGHGVGLCQLGAERMAQMGSSTEHILSTYLPGTEIARQPTVDDDPIVSSEHFELIYYSSQEYWVKQTLDTLEQWRKELGAHAEILPQRVRVQTWTRVADFIRATGEPGWMAAANDGQSISLQPLELLGRKHILSQTLRHELTHLVVHRLAAKGLPRWFEEGSVLYLTRERIETPPNALKTRRELDEAITKPNSEAEMKAAYVRALARVSQFARSKGDGALWSAIERPGPEDIRWMHAKP
jgi:stage II sporulation protein D